MTEEIRNFNLNIKGAEIYQAIFWNKFFIFKFANFLKKIFLVLFIFSFLLSLYGILVDFSQEINQRLIGLFLIFLIFTIFFQLVNWFFNLGLKRPKLKVKITEILENPGEYNLADYLDFETAKAVYQSIRFCISRNIVEVNSDILFYFTLINSSRLKFVFSRLFLNLDEIKKNLKKELLKIPPKKTSERRRKFSEDFQKVIFEGIKIAVENKKERVGAEEILIGLAKENSFFKKILIDPKSYLISSKLELDLKTEDIENLVFWLQGIEEKIERSKKFWEYENLLRKGNLAKEWLAGYTITLDKFSIDWTKSIRKNLPEIIGHKEEIELIERGLAEREINNILLIGEPGTGKRSIVAAIAKKSLLGQSLPENNYKRVVELDMVRLLSQLSSLEEIEVVLNQIFQEVALAGNVILVIDEFHNYVGQTNRRPGIIDISGILASYLHLSQFQIIAITTPTGLHQYIEQNPSLLNLFIKVEVSEISSKEALLVLEDLTFFLEKKYKIFITYPALREIVILTEKHQPSLSFPEKAIKILDEVTIYVSTQKKEKTVLPFDVDKVFEEKTQIPVGKIETKEKEILLNLETLLHERIINQEEAVDEVSMALRRARTEITIRKGPMGCFLFLGPTGVGKTETSKALAEIYFGREERMIRLDMSEFQAIQDIPRLLGIPGQEGLLTTPVMENPFSLVLLDEIEKAHPNILNLFLQVFDEGHLTDGLGRKVDFKNTIIIATSNAGAEIIWEEIRQNKKLSIVKEDLLSYLFKEKIFRPELINRFDAVVIFKPLSKENLLDIAQLMFQKLKKNLFEKGIEFVITEEIKEKIVELSYSPAFGAREMRRVIQEKIENILALALLSGKIRKGNRIKINPQNFEIEII